ncbi:MAG: class I SAM-dependent methyltransferase [Dermatophilaceae bacterium]
MARLRPLGVVTRGTTAPNRLRRCDRWITGPEAWRLRRAGPAPVVVDLGFGASPVTVLELSARLRRVRPDVEVVGLDIDPDRVRSARHVERPGVRFAIGGFEVPLPDGRRPVVIRAFNVLRQYDESHVPGAWGACTTRLADDGVFVDGTCDEPGRLAAWVSVGANGPRRLTLSWRLRGLDRPGVVAERLPKVLIHRNVPGEPVHALLTALDAAWEREAARQNFGTRQRFIAAVTALRDEGWPTLDGPSRWRLGELTVAWDAVAPTSAGRAARGGPPHPAR